MSVKARTSPGELALLALVLAASAIIVGLLAFVLWASFARMSTGTPQGFAGLSNYLALFGDQSFWTAVLNTIGFAAVTIAVAFGFGVPLAWLAERSDLPGREVLWTAVLASLVIPGFLTAMGWLFVAHPRIGFINLVLMGAFGLSEAPLPVTSIAGMGWVEGVALAPLVFLLTAPSLRMLDPALEEAALISGAGAGSVASRIVLPLVAPALLAALIYTTITAIGSFDIPAVIGLANRLYVLSTFIYVLAYPSAGFPDYSRIAAAGGLMIVLALVPSVFYLRLLGKARQFETITGKGYRPRRAALGRWRVPAWLFAGLYVFVGLVVPFVMTLVLALLPYPQPLTLASLRTLTLANFRGIPWTLLSRGALHTLDLVLAVPVAVVGLSLAFSWVVLRTRIGFRRLFDGVAFLPHAVPGVLFAVGAMLAALFVLRRFLPIYGTIGIVMLVYTIAWLSLGTRIVNGSLIQIHRDLEESARIAGAGTAAVLARVIAPLLAPAVVGLWIFVVLLCLRELTLAAFVTTPQNITLPIVSWILWTSGDLGRAAAVAVIIVLALAPFLLVYSRLTRRVGPIF